MSLDSLAVKDTRLKYRKPPLPPLSYVRRDGAKATGVIFCGGFMSELNKDELGEKIEKYVNNKGYSVIRFDYSNIGGSVWKTMSAPGGGNIWDSKTTIDDLYAKMSQGSVSETVSTGENITEALEVQTTHLDANGMSFESWCGDLESLLCEVTTGRQLLVGFDMGAWLALRAAAAHPERVAGVVGLSTAVDFLPRLRRSLSSAERERVDEGGEPVWIRGSNDPNDYVVTKRLLDESRPKHLLDEKGGTLGVKCPVRFVHYLKDKHAPYADLVKLTERLATADSEIDTVNKGGRKLTSDKQFKIVCEAIDQLLQQEEAAAKKAEEKKRQEDEERKRLAAERQSKLEQEQERERNRKNELKASEKQEKAAKSKSESEGAGSSAAQKLASSSGRVAGTDGEGDSLSERVAKAHLDVLHLQKDYYRLKIAKMQQE